MVPPYVVQGATQPTTFPVRVGAIQPLFPRLRSVSSCCSSIHGSLEDCREGVRKVILPYHPANDNS